MTRRMFSVRDASFLDRAFALTEHSSVGTGTKNSNIEALAGVYEAFGRCKTWRQAALARELDLRPERLRKMLEALRDQGWPLERDEDPPQVYWSVDRHWFGGGVLVPRASIPRLLRLLAYVPASPERAKVLRLFEAAAPAAAAIFEAVRPPHALSTEEEGYLRAVEEAIGGRRSIEMKYFSRHRGELEWRTISPHLVHLDDSLRVAAVCHRSDRLKWFRIDGIEGLQDASTRAAYRDRAPDLLESFLSESVAGFHAPGPKQVHTFVVREPTARWAKTLLKPPMMYEAVPGGIRVTAETAGVIQIARFLIGLGGDVCEVSPALADEVRRIAEAALSSLEA